MGVLRLGFVTTYMSDPLIAGFTTATAIHVGTSQIKYIFGLKIPRTDGMFQVIKVSVNIFVVASAVSVQLMFYTNVLK